MKAGWDWLFHDQRKKSGPVSWTAPNPTMKQTRKAKSDQTLLQQHLGRSPDQYGDGIGSRTEMVHTVSGFDNLVCKK